MKINLSIALLLFSLLVMSQTKRDIFLRDSIIKPINYKQVTNKKIYDKTYDLLKKTDTEFGYEKDTTIIGYWDGRIFHIHRNRFDFHPHKQELRNSYSAGKTGGVVRVDDTKV